jgi:hypothetical protein
MACVVISQPGIHIGCETGIKLRRVALVPHYVDESLLSGHRPSAGKPDTGALNVEIAMESARRLECVADPANV